MTFILLIFQLYCFRTHLRESMKKHTKACCPVFPKVWMIPLNLRSPNARHMPDNAYNINACGGDFFRGFTHTHFVVYFIFYSSIHSSLKSAGCQNHGGEPFQWNTGDSSSEGVTSVMFSHSVSVCTMRRLLFPSSKTIPVDATWIFHRKRPSNPVNICSSRRRCRFGRDRLTVRVLVVVLIQTYTVYFHKCICCLRFNSAWVVSSFGAVHVHGRAPI